MYFIILVTLFLCASKSVLAFHLQLYDGKDFQGLFYEAFDYNGQCTNLTTVGVHKGSSIKVDTCVLVFTGNGCTSYSIKIPPGDHPDLVKFRHATINFDNRIASYKLCNEAEGGNQVNVQLNGTYEGASTTFVDYQDVCSCITLPEFAHAKIMSLNNNGNCVKLYDDTECKEGSVEIQGGYSSESRDLNNIGFGGKTKSISVCDESPCIRLHAVVVKFVLGTNASNVAKMSIPAQVDLAATTTFINNGSATVSQMYQAEKELQETYKIARSASFSSIHKVDVAAGLSYERKSWLFGDFKAGLSFAYTYQRNTTNTENQEVIYQSKRMFRAAQRIRIPPCAVYKVDSFIKTFQNYPFSYEVHSHISGKMGNKQMTAEELRAKLSGVSGMEYMGDYDNFTVIAKTFGSLVADFGVEAVISGEGNIIDECKED